MLKHRVVFIESNTSGTGLEFVRIAAELGFDPIVLAAEPCRYSYLRSGEVPHLRIPTNDRSTLAGELDRLRQSAPIAAIFSTSDHFIAVAAELAARYGLNAANADAIRRCRDKYRQGKRLQEHGIRVPRLWRVQSKDEIEQVRSELSFPVVVKPVCGTGSVDVLLCRSWMETAVHVEKLLATGTNERGIAITPEALIQEYVAGPEYSVETFNECVIGITRKHLSPEPYFIETGHDFPAALAPATTQSIASTALGALCALELGFGPAHIEMRCSPESGPVIIEVNPRLAGGFIPSLVKLASGVDLVRATLELVSGGEIDLTEKCAGYASIRFLVATESGLLRDIEGIEEARAAPDVADVRLYRNVGDTISLSHDFRDRIGHVVGVGASASAAAAIASAAVSRIRLAWTSPLEAIQ